MREGVSEIRIDYGPGYRVYFTQRGEALVVLLAGGDKDSQKRDIRRALELAQRTLGGSYGKDADQTVGPGEHLETEEDMAAYLNVALEEGDLGLIMATLGDIARARRIAMVAQETGLGRESLYKSLSAEGNPEFATVLKVVRALGLRLQATAAPGGTVEVERA